MPVNLPPPDRATLRPIPGVELGATAAGIRKANRADLLLIRVLEGASVAGVFTQNRFCAAPVTVCREHLAASKGVRALLVNAGCANAGTGADGIARARASCVEVAKLIGCDVEQVLPFSTGVILEPLPIEKIQAALPNCVASLSEGHWFDAAQAIMTTDTVAKAGSGQVAIDGTPVSITGICKGVGMLRPNMATMLAYLATDAAVSAALMPQLVREVADASFNRVTVDGDTSTNDSFVLIATQRAKHALIKDSGNAAYAALRAALIEVAARLAQCIARDGEGATKFITVKVEGGKTEDECKKIAYGIAHSPLIKTAFFASDPNLGRIVMAIGNADIADLDVSRLAVYLDDILVVEKGGRAAGYTESDGQRVMKKEEITVRVVLNRGAAATTVWTCDFSYDYVKINAEYRT